MSLRPLSMLDCEYFPGHHLDLPGTDSSRIQQRGVYIGDRSQFADLPIEEYIADRDMMSTPRRDLQYPESVGEGLDMV